MNVFVDTNVLLDVIGAREPFYPAAAEIWSQAETGQLHGAISAISYNNIFYVVRKKGRLSTARKAITLLRDTFTTVPLDVRILNQAIDSELRDFEDAIQYFSALHSRNDYLITRDGGHYRHSDIPVVTPDEFLGLQDEQA